MKNKYLLLVIGSLFLTSINAQAFTLRNNYISDLKCTPIEKGSSITVKAKSSFDKIKKEGKFNCQTEDGMYISVCAVSEFQPIATFDTNDGSASCSTPELIKK